MLLYWLVMPEAVGVGPESLVLRSLDLAFIVGSKICAEVKPLSVDRAGHRLP